MLRAGYFLGRDSAEEMNASVPLVRVVAPPAPLLAAGDILDFGQALGADEDHIALARCQVAVALLRLALLAVLLDGLGDSPTGYESEGSSDNKGSTDSQVINCGVNLSSSFRALSEANSVFFLPAMPYLECRDLCECCFGDHYSRFVPTTQKPMTRSHGLEVKKNPRLLKRRRGFFLL